MDRTERVFKLAIDLFLTMLLWLVLGTFIDGFVALGVGFVLAHSLNFVLNAQVYVVLHNLGATKHNRNSVMAYSKVLQERIRAEKSIQAAAVFGSLSASRPSATPDLDLRLVRRSGIVNGIRACSFAQRERSRAFIKQFPLDVYVLDGTRSLAKLSKEDGLMSLHDPDGLFAVRSDAPETSDSQETHHSEPDPTSPTGT